ncbi:MAG: glycosyltransferase family 4 protein [Chloroflexia bacterium]|nr:glycosyltransferase family 4 protein [Chloroflexia bacterium]
MRALHVVQGYLPWIGGSQRFFQELSERLVAAGHQVTVATSDAGELEHFWCGGRKTVGPPREIINGVEVLRFPVHRWLGRPLLFSLYRRLLAELSGLPLDTEGLLRRLARLTPRLPAFERYLEQSAPHFDLVHGANITLDFMLAPALEFARRRGIPFVLTPMVHLGVPGQRRVQRYYTMRHQRALMQEATALITQTSLESDLLVSFGISPEAILCTGSGVNPDQVTGGNGQRFRERYGLQGPIVFYLGTQTFDKGTVQLVEALRLLWSEGRAVELVLAGQAMSPIRAYLQRLLQEDLPLHWLGAISEEEKRDLLAAGEVFCMTSCTDSFGIVYLEAWANGVPVIGARAGGVPAVIEEGRDGLLVEFADERGLARAISRLLDDPALRQAMGRRGREKVQQRMTWARVYERIETLYQRLLAGETGYPSLH